jgi:S-adenosylmethionine synthetase
MADTWDYLDYFTSESVCSGHPDKICDAISDAVLDAALAQDPDSRTGIETVAGANKIALFGEIKTNAELNFELVARQKVAELGYIVPAWGLATNRNFLMTCTASRPRSRLASIKPAATSAPATRA